MDGESFYNHQQYNVLGGPLIGCSTDPMTGFYRDGCCATGPEDRGVHTVCALMSDAFLVFSQQAGNDLITPRPEFGFAGLKAGDFWCLCAARWEQARQAGFAPQVRLASTNRVTLAIVPLEILRDYAIDAPDSLNN